MLKLELTGEEVLDLKVALLTELERLDDMYTGGIIGERYYEGRRGRLESLTERLDKLAAPGAEG